MANKKQEAFKMSAGKKINTKWLNNVMKSIGSTTMDSFKTIAPNLYSAGEGITSSVKELRTITTGNSIANNAGQLTKNKYINYGKRAFDNILDDLKTGNLNNTERMNKAISDSFGGMMDDFSFDDEEGANITFNYMEDEKSNNDATFELAKSIERSGEANIKAQKASVDAMISVTSASMLQQQEIGRETNAHLGNINNNIAALVAYQQENTTKFYESAMAVFDRYIKKDEEENDSGNNKTTRLFNSNGGINVSAYKDYVKKQIKSSFKDSKMGSMADMILSDDTALELAVSNPIGFASKMIIQGMVPHLVTNTIKGMEDAFTGFMPTMLAKLGEWRKNEEDGIAGSLKRLIGNAFGIDIEKLNKVDLGGKVSKDAAIFDGMTRNSIVEVIPKHLREMSSYLRDIAEHFKIDTKKSKQQSEVFDAGTGKYISIQELQKNIAEKITNSVTDAMSTTEFGRAIANGGNELVGKDAKTYERMSKQMFEFMSRMDGAFTPESFNTKDKDSKINQILSSIDANNKQDQKVLNVLTETINLLGKNQKGLHHSQFAAIRGIEAKNDTISSLEKDYDIENLIAAGITSETDIDEFVDLYGGNKKAQQQRLNERERQKREEKVKEKREYKNRRKGSARSLAKRSLQNTGVIERNDTKEGRERIASRNADASTVPGFIANTGGHLKDSMFAAMNGDSKGSMEALGAIFTDGMKTFWGSIKENFLSPLKESIFGKKGEDGYIDGGLFSGVQNKTKDIWKEIGFHINGKEYTDSAGNKHEADPENSVIGKVKGIFGTITDSVKYRLFGDKDEDGKEAEKKGNAIGGIIDTFKEGILGWKHALFGDEPEKDADQQLSDFKDKAMKAIPDLGVGAIGGLAVSQLSGGLLGTIIGGPITGIALGMGTSLLSKSTKFQDYLFGPEIEDENGNKSRVGGLISKKTQDMFKDPGMKKSAIGGAALGIAKSFIFGSSGGILGSLVGGPIAGAMFGAGLGILKKSEMFQKFMYGEMGEDGERSGGFKDKLKAKIKSTFGKDNKEDGEEGKKMKKTFGMSALGAGAGGVMGLLMGGPVVGSVIGLASGIAASTDKFKKWFFGEKDEDGNKTKLGMVDKLGNWMHTEVMAPMKNKVLDLVEDAKTTLKYDVFNVATILMEPAVDYVKESAEKLKEKFSKGLDYVKEKLFAPLSKLTTSIMKPVRKAVGAVVDFAYKQVKTMATLPFKIMKNVAMIVSSPFIKLAKGIKNIIGWVGKKIFKAVGFITKGAAKLISMPLNLAAGLTTYAGSKVKDKLAGVGGEVKKKDHIEGDDWRTKLKNNKIDKKNELRENKKNRCERSNMAYNRSLVAKTLGYDVKYLTEENYEAALAVDKRLASKMKGPGFGKFSDSSKRQFEKDPRDVAKEQRAKISKSSDADIATMDTKDQDVETRNLIQSTRQTSILERILNWLTGKRSKFSDSYGDVSDAGDVKQDDARRESKPDETDNTDVEGNEAEDTRHEYEKLADEIFESGGAIKWIGGKLNSFADNVKNFFTMDSLKEGFENSELKHGIDKGKGIFNSIKKIFDKDNRSRAKGGPVDKGETYLVGDGGEDPSAAELFIPKTNGKILSQKNGGIKVVIEGFASKAINSIKSIFTKRKPGGIEPLEGELLNNSPDISSITASINANGEADYDEKGNLIKEKVDSSLIDDIKDPDEKEDAIIAADNASDLANAKNVGSFISQRKKKEEEQSEESARKQLDILHGIKSGQEEGNKDRKEHSNLWSSIFSKKGLLTLGAIGLFAKFPEIIGVIKDDILPIVKSIGGTILGIFGDAAKNTSDQYNFTEENNARTDGNSMIEEGKRKLDQVTSGNILMLSEDGTASASTSAIEKFGARTWLNWNNRYEKGLSEHIPFIGKSKKKQKKFFRAVDSVASAPKKAINRIKNGKSSEYDKLIMDGKKNHVYHAKSTGQYFDQYNREILTTDQWDELVKENGEEWATNNKSKYFVPDDDSFPKKPEGRKKTVKEKVTDKISDTKDKTKSKIKETKAGKKYDEVKDTITGKKNTVTSKITDGVDEIKDTIKNSKTGQAVQNAKATIDNTKNSAKNAVKNGLDNAKGKVKSTIATKTDDLAKSVGKHAGGDGLFSKVCGYITDFFETLTKRLNGKVGKKSQGTVGKIFSKFGPKNVKQALTKVWDKACLKISEVLGGRVSAAAVSAGISEAVMVTFAAIDGVSGAAKLFKVRSEDVDGTMRLVAGLFGGIAGSTPGAIVELVFSIIGPIIGIDPMNTAALLLYQFLKGKEGAENLKVKQEKFEKEYVEYKDVELKKQYDTQIKAGLLSKEVTYDEFVAGVADGKYSAATKSFDDYNAEVNASLSDKATNAVTKTVTDAGHAIKEKLWGEEKRKDKNGNIYSKNKDGTWEVTDKNGQVIGNIANDALPKEGIEDISEKTILRRGVDSVKSGIDAARKKSAVVDTILNTGSSLGGGVIKQGKTILKTAGNLVSDVGGTAVSVLKNNTYDLGKRAFDGLKEATVGSFNKFKDGDILGGLASIGKGAWNATGGNLLTTAKNNVTSVWNGAKSLGGHVIDGYKETGKNIVDTVKNTGGALIDGAKNVGGKIAGGATKAFGFVKGLFGGKENSEEEKKKKEQENQAKQEKELSNTKYKIANDSEGKYWKYNPNNKNFYLFNKDGKQISDQAMNLTQITQSVKDKKLVPEKENVIELKKKNSALKNLLNIGKTAIQGTVSKAGNFIKEKILGKKTKLSDIKLISVGSKRISDKSDSVNKYIYYEKKDESYYACLNGKWYHFNKDGQKIDEKEIAFSFINAKFISGDLVRDKMTGSMKISNEKELKKYIKSISKKSKKTDWETKKDIDEKKKKEEKGKVNQKKRKTQKVFMGPDGDYYKKNKDGTYNHYNSIGNIIDENIDGEDKDTIEKKIKNGVLVASEVTSKKKVDVNSIHGKINKTTETMWGTVKKTLSGGLSSITSKITGSNTTASSTRSNSGIFSTIGSAISGLFGGKGIDEEKDEIGGNGEDELNGFKFFSQKDKRWKDKDYSFGKSKSTMGKAGCGPTAMSMVASQLSGKKLSPIDIANDARSAGFRDKTGTNANFISYESKKLNLPSVQTEKPSADYISSQVESGHPMILNGVATNSKTSPYTTSGHYIVAVGKNESGDILINDPRGRSKSVPVSPEKLASETRLGWSFGGSNKTKMKRLIGIKKKGGYGENSFTADDVIAVAKNEVGYSEKSSDKNLDDKKKNAGTGNFTKYAKEVGHTNGLAWCATFVTWCFVKAANGDKKKAKEVLCSANTASCSSNVSAFKSANRYDMKPQPGDVVFFMNGSSHTGLVIAVNGTKITTIEGNTSPGKFNRDGGCVAQKEYDYKQESRISGFGHPKYDASSSFAGVSQESSEDATTTAEVNTDASNGFLDTFQTLATEYANRAIKGDYNSDFSSVLNQNASSSSDSTDSSSNSEAASAASEIEGKGNIEKVWNFFAKNGFSAAATSGIIGNMYQESGVNPASIQGNGAGPAAGIFQWENYNTKTSRWKALDDRAKKEGKSWKDLGVQLDFALSEMKGKDIDNRLKGKYGVISDGKSKQTTDIDGKTYTLNAIPDGFEGFKRISDVEEAVKSFEAAYERAGKPNFKRRIDKAKEVYNKYGKSSDGGSGGFGDYDEEIDSFRTSYTGHSNNINTKTTSDDKLFKLLSGDHSDINRILNKSTSEEKIERLLEKMINILESINDSSSSSIEQLKKISTNTKRSGQFNTNIVNTDGSNNVVQNGSTQSVSESRNSILAKQLARG